MKKLFIHDYRLIKKLVDFRCQDANITGAALSLFGSPSVTCDGKAKPGEDNPFMVEPH